MVGEIADESLERPQTSVAASRLDQLGQPDETLAQPVMFVAQRLEIASQRRAQAPQGREVEPVFEGQVGLEGVGEALECGARVGGVTGVQRSGESQREVVQLAGLRRSLTPWRSGPTSRPPPTVWHTEQEVWKISWPWFPCPWVAQTVPACSDNPTAVM